MTFQNGLKVKLSLPLQSSRQGKVFLPVGHYKVQKVDMILLHYYIMIIQLIRGLLRESSGHTQLQDVKWTLSWLGAGRGLCGWTVCISAACVETLFLKSCLEEPMPPMDQHKKKEILHLFHRETDTVGLKHVNSFKLQLHLQDEWEVVSLCRTRKLVLSHEHRCCQRRLGGRRAPPLRVFETLCVCLTKPISQSGVEYQTYSILPPPSEPALQALQSQLKNRAKYLNVITISHKCSDLL